MNCQEGRAPRSEIEALRGEIDRVDEGLVALIAARRDLAVLIGGLKQRHGLHASDPAREAAVVRRSAEMARDRGLSPEGVRDVFWCLISLSHRALACRIAEESREGSE